MTVATDHLMPACQNNRLDVDEITRGEVTAMARKQVPHIDRAIVIERSRQRRRMEQAKLAAHAAIWGIRSNR